MEAWSRMLMGKSRRWGRVEEMMSALVVTVHKVTQGVCLQSAILYHSCLFMKYSNTEVDALYQATFPSLATTTTATLATATTHMIWAGLCVLDTSV